MRGVAFTTESGNRYFFDAATGVVFPCPDVMVSVLHSFESQTKTEIIEALRNEYPRWEVEAWYKFVDKWVRAEAAFFGSSKTTEGSARDTAALRAGVLALPMPQLIIIATEDCNLRCKYCVFSGTYEHQRRHNHRYMDFATAQKAVDYYYHLLSEGRGRNPFQRPSIGFYGGEPLLNFQLIKKVVEYVDEMYDGDEFPDIQWVVTTNGTLLQDAVFDYLVRHGFQIYLSLDGPKAVHDANRVFVNGKGTFDTIMRHIRRLTSRLTTSGEVSLPYKILVTYTKHTDLCRVYEFFIEHYALLGQAVARFNPVVPYQTTYYASCRDTSYLAKQSARLLFKKYRRLVTSGGGDGQETTLLEKLFGTSHRMVHSRGMLDGFSGAIFQCGECIPGSKIAVDCEGMLHVCEKINCKFPIGTVDNGLSWKKISEVIRDYDANVIGRCKGCDFSRLCQKCYATCALQDHFSIGDTFCADRRAGIPATLSVLYSLLEKNPQYLSTGTLEEPDLPYGDFCNKDSY